MAAPRLVQAVGVKIGYRTRMASDSLTGLRRVARLMDASFVVPGTRFRFGWDAILGLLPGVGDGVGLAISVWILLQAARRGVPRPLLARMAGHVAVDGLVGSIPLLGDLFDASYRANQKNVELLERWLEAPEGTPTGGSTLGLWALAGVSVLILGGAVYAVVALFSGAS